MKILIAIAAFLFCSSTFAQLDEIGTDGKKIQIGEVRLVGNLYFELYMKIDGKDSVCYLVYRNQEYSVLTEYEMIAFSPEDNTIDKLYNLIIKVLTDKAFEDKDHKIKVMLGETECILSRSKSMAKYVFFWTDDGYFYINERQAKKLFNKKD